MFKSYRTTYAGIGTILAALGNAAVAIANDQPVDWGATIAAIVAGVGLIAARDHKVTSAEAGVK